MGLLHHQKLIVGYDLGAEYAQISYSITPDTVETVSSVAGEEQYNIPLVLCKRFGVNQWFYGKEALRCAEEKEGILVENLLQLALDGEQVQIDGIAFDPVSLLALFMKRSLGMLSQIYSPDRLSAMMITCEKLDHRMIRVLNQTVEDMQLKTDKVYFQSHVESFYNYTVRQPEELWKSQTTLLEYRGGHIVSYSMKCNRRTIPVVVFIEEKDYAMTAYEPMPETSPMREEKMQRLDREFKMVAEQICGSGPVTSVYLIGEHYSDEWMKESLRLLCMGRRVFQGNNLYSKGACYALLERLSPSEIGRNYVFLGRDKLKTNVGMKILRQGEESYFALLDAGSNWYEAEQTFEFYIQDGNELELQITSLTGNENKTALITLEGLPEGISRIRTHIYLSEEKALIVEAEDLGFGNFRPASGLTWKEEIAL